MPATGAPIPLRYWGADAATRRQYEQLNRDRMADYKRQQEEEYFARHGSYPQQKRASAKAADEAEREWKQLVDDMTRQMGEIRNAQSAQSVRDFYQQQMSGAIRPFDDRTLNTMISRATDTSSAGARSGIERLREGYASRGMARSGALMGAEQDLRTQAIMESIRSRSDIGAQGAIENFASRERGAGAAGGFHLDTEREVSALLTRLAELRAQRTFDPEQFGATGAGGVRRDVPTEGGYGGQPFDYSPINGGGGGGRLAGGGTPRTAAARTPARTRTPMGVTV